MADAYIFDAVRTPRGKGKSTGSLHEITSLSLARQTLEAIRDRNNLDTSKVDDVILGCVAPVGEQGVIRRPVGNQRFCKTIGLWSGPRAAGKVGEEARFFHAGNRHVTRLRKPAQKTARAALRCAHEKQIILFHQYLPPKPRRLLPTWAEDAQ